MLLIVWRRIKTVYLRWQNRRVANRAPSPAPGSIVMERANINRQDGEARGIVNCEEDNDARRNRRDILELRQGIENIQESLNSVIRQVEGITQNAQQMDRDLCKLFDKVYEKLNDNTSKIAEMEEKFTKKMAERDEKFIKSMEKSLEILMEYQDSSIKKLKEQIVQFVK